MNNENELHDVTFKIRYPSKKEKYNVFIVLLYVVFFVSQILILLRAALTGRYTLKEIIIRRVEK